MTSTTMNAQAAPKPSAPGSGFKVAVGIFGVLVLLGLIYFIESLINGHEGSGVNDAAPWGIYIAGFIFFVGASAGSTIIGLLIHAFGREEFAPLGMRALLVGFLSLVAAVLFIMVDVGYFFRMFMVPLIWNNPSSFFFYTSTTYYLFALILLGELYYTTKIVRGNADEKDKKWAKWLAIAAVPFALIVVHAPHGGLFAVIAAREFWNNPLLPPHFADVALVSGSAIVLLVAIATSRIKQVELVSKKALTTMSTLLLWFLVVAAFFDFFDSIVLTYSNTAVDASAWSMLTGGNAWLTILHVAGYVTGFIILFQKSGREDTGRMATAAVAILIGVAAYRYSLVTTGLFVPLLPFIKGNVYTPTWPEIAVTLGILSLVSLAYLILVRVLPMEEDQKVATPTPAPSVSPAAEQQTA